MSRRAFSLLEVLVALALIVALLGAMFAFLFDLLSTRSRVLELIAQQRAVQTLIERVETDLSCCLVGDARSGPGVAGDAASLRILTRGVLASVAERGPGDPAVLADLQRREYRFDASERRIMAAQVSAGESGSSGPGLDDMGGSVGQVRFAYFDGSEWRSSFDSLETGRLPVAVRISAWFDPPSGDDDPLLDPETSDAVGDDRSTADRGVEGDRSGFGAGDGPPPDRARVILVPDATGDDEASADDGTPASRSLP